MESTFFLSKVLGVYLAIVSFSLLINRKYFYKHIIKNLTENPAIVFLFGIIATVIGFIMILYHNTWVWQESLVITLISWIIYVEGIIYLLFPKWINYFYKKMSLAWLTIFSWIGLSLGIYLIISGFYN